MALTKKEETRVASRVYATFCLLAAVVLLAVGLCLWKGGSTIVSKVNDDVKKEKIYFPEKGSPMFSAEMFPEVQKYAGKQVVDGEMALAFAEDYLGKQLDMASGGKTLSEVTAQLAANPTSAELQQLYKVMFEGGVTKTIMSADIYGSWMQGKLMKQIGMGMLVVAVVLGVLGIMQWARYKRS